MKKIDLDKTYEELIHENDPELKKQAIEQALNSNDLIEVCLLLRKFTTPQSTSAEKIIMNHLGLKKPLDEVSGDGIKNDIRYEIKASLHDVQSSINIRQIRPHHSIDYYIIVAYNIFNGTRGEARIFKIPSEEIYKLIVNYGGYTHGTVSVNGAITLESIKDLENTFEYSLTAKPNAAAGTKAHKLWGLFLKYEVEYKSDNF